jgi:hypothetical protein
MLRPSRVEDGSPFVRPPSWAVTAAAASVVASLALALVGVSSGFDAVELSVAGYALGSLVTALLVVIHRGLVQRAARQVWYAPRMVLDRIANVLLVTGLLTGAFHAFFLATELARR